MSRTKLTEFLWRLGLLAAGILIASGIALVAEQRANAQGGTYSLDLVFTDMWDVSAPCYNSGNCNFSCNAANVGRSCYADICRGTGNGDTAYLDHNEYVCNYYPPATCADSGQIGTYPDCRFPTCADDPTLDGCSCSATNACGQTNSGTYSGGSCNATAPALPGGYGTSCSVSNSCGSETNYGTINCSGSCSASAPSEASCAPSCVANMNEACNVNSCGEAGGAVQCDGSCSGGTPTADKCPADPGTQCSASQCSDGGPPAATATLTASPSSVASGESSTLTWSSTDATSCVGGGFSTGGATSGSVSTGALSSSQSYTVQCTGPGGTNTDGASVTVTAGGGGAGGGSCTDAGPVTLTASPNRVQAGSAVPITIEWTVAETADTTCILTNANTGAEVGTSAVNAFPACDSQGAATVTGLGAQTVFRLSCGALAEEVIVNVVPQFSEF